MRRLEAVTTFYQTTRDELAKRLHVLSFAGRDAVLGVPDRGGLIRPTPLFETFRARACEGDHQGRGLCRNIGRAAVERCMQQGLP